MTTSLPKALDSMLLAKFRQDAPVGVPIPDPTLYEAKQSENINVVGGLLAYYDSVGDQLVLDASGVGGGGQTNVTLANGLNSNIATGFLRALRIGGPSAAFSVGGFTAGTAGGSLLLSNTTSQPMTLVHEDASSLAANRIDCQAYGGSITLQPKTGSAFFLYDTTESRWVLLSVGVNRPLKISVDDYGGGPGVGASTNDTAIARAIAAAVAAGIGIVEFSAGTYSHSATIACPNNVYLRGQGRGATTLTKTTLGDGVLTSNGVNVSITGNSKIERMTLNNARYPAVAAWQASTAYTAGQIVKPTNLSPKCLVCVTGGTSGTHEPIGKLFPQTPNATRVPDIWLTGTPTTAHTIDIKITTPGALGTMAWDYSIDGGAFTGSPITSSAFPYTHAIPGTQYTANFAADNGAGGFYTDLTYWTPSFYWSLSNTRNIPDGAGALVWQVVDAGAGYHDQGSTKNGIDDVLVTGYCIGAELDQSEDFFFRKFSTSGNPVGLWLLSGAAGNPDGPALPDFQFTNAINGTDLSIYSSIAILDDGGIQRGFHGDFSSSAPIVTAGAGGALYKGYFESPSLGIAGGMPCILRTLFQRLFSRETAPGQAGIKITGSQLGAQGGAFVVDATSSGSASCTGLEITGNNMICNSATMVRGAADLNSPIWHNNPNAGSTQVVFDGQPFGALVYDKGQGYDGVAGYSGGMGIGFLADGVAAATLDVAGGVRVRPYTWSGAASFGNGATNDNLTFAYGYTVLVITSGPTAAFSLSGIASGNVKSGYWIRIINLVAHQMTILNNAVGFSTGESTAGNTFYTSSGSNQACRSIDLMYLDAASAGAGNAGWYEVAHS